MSSEQARPTRTEGQEPAEAGRSRSEISGAIVQLFVRYAGRGPTKAHTTIDRDLVAVVLEEVLTRGELTLVAAGEAEPVRELRRRHHDAMREEMIETVERITGRKVMTALSDLDPERNIAVESFVLERQPERS